MQVETDIGPLPKTEGIVGRMKTELLSGLTVAMALVPEAIAFAFVAGVEPLVGLYAAFVVGLVTALFGGRPGMISGATGALAVVAVSLVASHGVEYLFATVVLMGAIQLLAGVLHLGKFIRLVPHPVMLGFVIFLAQFGQFKEKGPDGTMQWLGGTDLSVMLGLAALTMAVIWGAGKFVKAVPAPLLGILVTTGVVIAAGLDVRTVGDMASIKGDWPQWHLPEVPFNFETLEIIFPYALIMAAVGLIESLLTLNLVAEVTETRGRTSKECVAQGAANVLTGFLGGMGGCAMIGQSMINVESGGRTRVSGTSAALFLLAFVMVASQWIEMIPLAALVGVMFMVVIGTFAWSSLRIMRKIPRTDAFVLILVSAVTVKFDLAVAVIIGVIVSALAFAWKSSRRLHTRIRDEECGSRVYLVEGLLFFGSAESFASIFRPKTDPEEVIIDFVGTRVLDHSGLQAIDALAEKYKKAGKRLRLRHLSPDCRALLEKAGNLVEVDVIEDPHYGLAVDYGAGFDEDRDPTGRPITGVTVSKS